VPVLFKIEGNVGKDISASSLANEGEVLFKPGTNREVLDIIPRQIPKAQTILDDLGATYFNLVLEWELEGVEYFEIIIRIND